MRIFTYNLTNLFVRETLSLSTLVNELILDREVKTYVELVEMYNVYSKLIEYMYYLWDCM